MAKILLKPKLIKHNRDIIPKDLSDYGELAKHDLMITILLAYEMGVIPDANGTKVNVSKEWMESTMKKTNKYIKNHVDGLFAKTKSFLSSYKDALVIPLSFDHQSSAKHNSGFSNGLLWIEEYNNELGLFVNAIVRDNEIKSKIQQGLIRSTSLGTRADGSIKEISFVQNPAIPHGGILMSENQNGQIKLSDDCIKLQEEVNFLELQISELQNTISNDILFCEMLKNGKIRPTAYQEFIKRDYQDNKSRNNELVAHDIGIIFGNSIQPVLLKEEQKSDIIKASKIITQYKQQKNNKNQNSNDNISFAENNSVNFMEQHYKSLLTEIKDLALCQSELAIDLIATELGENNKIFTPGSQDLQGYLTQLQELKNKKQLLTIQLQELSNE